MASSSSSSSSSSSKKYDVFLSFRKEDTGRTFVSHLYRSLHQKGVRTYRDQNQQTGEGARMSDEVSQAIEESAISVVVVSENYASSTWCLEVLAKITEGLDSTFTIIPVLYDVHPHELIVGIEKFVEAFRRHDEREDPKTVNRWRDSLSRLSDFLPLCSCNCEDDSKMLDDLITRISSAMSQNITPSQMMIDAVVPFSSYLQVSTSTSILRPSFSSFQSSVLRSMGPLQWYKTLGVDRVPSVQASISSALPLPADPSLSRGMREYLFREYVTQDAASVVTKDMPSASSQDHNLLLGMDRHKKAVYGLLDLDSRNQVRTIGICGMEGVGKTTLAECVFDDISKHFQHHCFLNSHQNRISPSLLDHLTRTRSSRDSFEDIKPSLVNRNILLVVDDVRDSEQLKDIMKVSHWLSPGSRVIMTSKDKSSLVSCGVKHVYEMGFLRYDEALHIFSQFAFKQDYPRVGFEQVTVRAVHLAGHLPLALKILGSFLCGKDEETWIRTLQRLDASQGNNGIREVCSYVEASEYLQIKSRRYIVADEGEYSPSYHMLL
ncbi:NB-ARC domain-containing protein [Hirschfeldia incana]|nr:NB-ARC domain-containing protein [Hirschfeldia incana]